ncbi:MAG: hypothetical protein Q7T18_05790 [Sedimentisphaerales bacterium]|nr:hypothetical protein [Sedimentisphaerales bacterium]
MVAGLPGTGIGGLFYLLLALYMPVCEFFKTLQGKTSLKRWGFITLQLLFVAGILAVIWAEVWLLNQGLLWLRQNYHMNLQPVDGRFTFGQTGSIAFTSAMASFISLTFLLAVVCVLRVVISRPKKPASAPNHRRSRTTSLHKN